MFTFKFEKELHSFLLDNFNSVFNFEFVASEFSVTGGRIDLIGKDEENIYLIELKRDIVTQETLNQLDKYISVYESNKPIIGIAVAPVIDSSINLSICRNKIITKQLTGVTCTHDYKENPLKNRERIGTSLPIELVKRLKDHSDKTMIPISKIIEKSIEEYLKSAK